MVLAILVAVSILVVLDDALVHALEDKLYRRLSVSILVVLDDALVQVHQLYLREIKTVSILVVLDDALVLTFYKYLEPYNPSLNPCCAGRCSSTRERETILIINMLQNYTEVIFAFLNQKLTIS